MCEECIKWLMLSLKDHISNLILSDFNTPDNNLSQIQFLTGDVI